MGVRLWLKGCVVLHLPVRADKFSCGYAGMRLCELVTWGCVGVGSCGCGSPTVPGGWCGLFPQ